MLRSPAVGHAHADDRALLPNVGLSGKKMGQQIRKSKTNVRFISPQLLNTVWVEVSTATTELQVEVVSGENSNDVKARSKSWQSIVDDVCSSKTFKYYIQGASRPVLCREVPASGGPGKTVESGRSREPDWFRAMP